MIDLTQHPDIKKSLERIKKNLEDKDWAIKAHQEFQARMRKLKKELKKFK